MTDALLEWYRVHGRTHLPWRRTRDPYRVLVSEFMLQQTQVERVIPLYDAFMERFPDIDALADASSGDVIRMWRGLGYNSRAIRLHALAQTIVRDQAGVVPRDREALLALPGIGPYTASAIRAFAFDEPDVALDTNLRRIIHRTALGLEYPPLANDRELDERARTALVPGNAHDWNSAMMDVGATICTARAPKCLLCPLRAECAAAPIDAIALAQRAKSNAKRTPQEALPFERTTRFLRGRIIDKLRDIPAPQTTTISALVISLGDIVPADRIDEIPTVVEALEREGIIARDDRAIRLH